MHDSTASTTTGPLSTTLAGLSLRNPVIPAAGTAGYSRVRRRLDLRVSALVTVDHRAREGNKTGRILDSKADA